MNMLSEEPPHKVSIIVVDLDCTLSEVNLPIKLFFKSGLYAQLKWVKDCILQSKAHANYQLGAKSHLLGDDLRLRPHLVRFLKENANTCKIILATGSPCNLAEYVTEKLGFIHDIIASNDTIICTGAKKAEKIKELLHDEKFMYIGDSHKDVPIWKIAEWPVVVAQPCNKHMIPLWQREFPNMRTI